VNNSTVHRWLDRYEEQGVAGLRTRPRSGRPPVWDEAYEYELVELVRHDPPWWGWAHAEWTASLLAEHLAQRRGIRLGAERVRELLRLHGVPLKGQ
jgi:transposase